MIMAPNIPRSSTQKNVVPLVNCPLTVVMLKTQRTWNTEREPSSGHIKLNEKIAKEGT